MNAVMPRALVLFFLLLAAPGALLAVLAWRLAGREHAEGAAALEARLEEEAEALARRIGAALEDAAGRAREALRAAGALAAVLLGPEGEPAYGGEPPEEAAGPEELRFFTLSLRGGESYEHARRDPERAIDAYTFYLPRLRSAALRSELRFHAARAALAAGREALGRALLEAVFAEGEGSTARSAGLPPDILAGLRLLDLEEEGSPGRERRLSAFRERLRRLQGSLTSSELAWLAGRAQDRELQALAGERRAIELAIERRPELRSGADAALDGGHLLIALPAAGGRRAILREPLALPRLAAGDLEARLLETPEDGGAAAAAGRSLRAVRLSESGPPLAFVELRDPERAAKAAALDRRRDASRGLVALLVLATLAGGAALARAARRERRLAELRARLLANLSHELKTPITSIRIFAEMLAEDPLDERRTRRFGELLRAESLRLGGLIESLLELSRRGRGEEELALEPVDVAQVLRRLAEAFAWRAREQGVDFRAELPEPAEGKAAGGERLDAVTSAAAVERIALNLLDNALKYRRPEGAEVRLEARRRDGLLLISVADNGPGIPRSERDRVFEEFTRLSYDDYAVSGSGLGLAIARRLARRLGGDVRIESREGPGSTFTLELPAAPPAEGGA